MHPQLQVAYDGFKIHHLIPFVLTLCLLYHLLCNYLKLRHIPGPFLAGCTPLWRTYHQWRGQLRHKIVALHDAYGPFVRYGPNTVSIRDASVIQPIYSGVLAGGKTADFTINDSYKPLLGIDPKTGQDVRSLVTMDDAPHAKLRRAVAGPFSANSIAEMEEVIEATILELVDIFDGYAAEGKVLNLSQMLLWYSLDNACKIVFGEPGGCMRSETDVQGFGEMIRGRVHHWGKWSSLPGMERLIYRNPIALRLRNTQPADFARQSAARIQDRFAKPWLAKEPDLLNKLIETKEKYPDVMDAKGTMGIVMSTITGAADTTASTLTAALYYLMTHPEKMSKLRAELISATVTTPIPKWTEVKGLSYLDAVVKESMRLCSILNWPMERLVPKGGATLANTFFEEGTSVGVLPTAMHMDRNVYGEDITAFKPERWLSGDNVKTKRMEASFLGFSRGKRVCIGQNIAIMQLKKVVSIFAMRFDIGLSEASQELEADYTGAIIMMKALPVKVARRDY